MKPKQIKKLINQMGGSTRHISVLLNISPTTLHRWLVGDSSINLLNKTNLEVLSQIIEKETKIKNMDSKSLVRIVIQLMRANLWKGWEAFSDGEIHEKSTPK